MFRFIQITVVTSGFLGLILTLLLLIVRPQPIGWILYTVAEDETSAIYKMRPDGSQPQKLSPDAVYDSSPQWSPDGKWIVFERRTTESPSEVYVMRADGSEVRNLSQHSLPDTSPNWSPNSQAIVYLSNRDGYQQIYQVRRDGTHPNNISSDATTWGEAYWSPKGDWIIYEHWLNGLIRYNLDTEHTENIIDTRHLGILETIQWVSHGRWLVTSSQFNGAIYRIYPNTGYIEFIPLPNLFAHLPQVSPDGHWLTMVAITDENDKLVLAKPDGTQLQILASFAHINQPQWSPDGGWLVFPARENRNWDIYRIQRNGTQLENLTQSSVDEREVQWSMSILLLDWHPQYWLSGASFLLLSISGAISKLLAKLSWRVTVHE